MSKHTPGPWLVCKERPFEILMDDSNGEEIYAQIASVEWGNTEPDQAIADAHLIAAAPDLLAALRAVMRCASGELERPITERQPWGDAERLIKIALAKAEGREG